MSVEAVIVPKLTVVEWKMKTSNISMQDQINLWKKQGADADKKIASHYRQIENIEKLGKALNVPIIHRDDFNVDVAKKYNIIFSPGGDNHLQYVSRFVTGDQLVVGINSDPETSKGGILSFKPEHIDYLRDCLDKNSFETEKWTRLQAVLDGELLPFFALSEIFVGELKNRGISRSIINYRGINDEQKNSGLVIATGSGLTGWYRNIVGHWKDEVMEKYSHFPRTAPHARFVCREKDLDSGFLEIGDLDLGEELTIFSLGKDTEIDFDPDPSDDSFSFNLEEGSKVSISVAHEHPLRVAILP
ncbi:MAG: hypothetical protein WCV81_04170 [Microgenomates group bacterium]|jgi:hypothetical protein